MTYKSSITQLEDNRRDINYPEKRAGYEEPRELFSWRGSTTGRMALVALFFYVNSKIDVLKIVLGRKYKEYGVTAETTTQFMQRAVPELFVEYERAMGKSMPPDLIIKRVYPWYLEPREHGVRGKNKTIGPEHPLKWATGEDWNAGLARAIRHL